MRSSRALASQVDIVGVRSRHVTSCHLVSCHVVSWTSRRFTELTLPHTTRLMRLRSSVFGASSFHLNFTWLSVRSIRVSSCYMALKTGISRCFKMRCPASGASCVAGRLWRGTVRVRKPSAAIATIYTTNNMIKYDKYIDIHVHKT